MKRRSLTYVGAFLSLIVTLWVAMGNFKPETTIKIKPEVTQVISVPKTKTKIKDWEQSPVSEISLEVQRRLTTAGFKTDSFIAVQTKKR